MNNFNNNRLFHDLPIKAKNHNNLNQYAENLVSNYFKLKDDSTSAIEAGQTYFGQFIAHDLVPSTNFHIDRKTVMPTLNLESLYGLNTLLQKKISPLYFSEEGLFKLGLLECGTKLDLIRHTNPHNDKQFLAIIPDQRNDENIIISQFHVLWQRYHNAVLNHLTRLNKYKRYDNFLLTIQIVQTTYHLLILNSFLAQIVHPELLNAYRTDNNFKKLDNFFISLLPQKYQRTCIPLEFSHAAFRFGHSMVRNRYNLQRNQGSVGLHDILGKSRKKLEMKNVIDWEFFFQLNSDQDSRYYFESLIPKATDRSFRSPNTANSIDTSFAFMMRVQVKNELIDIRKINVLASLNEPTAEYRSIYEELSKCLTRNSELFKPSEKPLDNKCHNYHFPLWISILQEAEEASSTFSSNGLGRVGSLIIIEVLLSAIKRAQDDIFSTNAKDQTLEFIYEYVFKKNISFNDFIQYIMRREMQCQHE